MLLTPRFLTFLLASLLALPLAACGGSHPSVGLTCGAGTTQQGSTCVPADAGGADAGPPLSCGPGTYQGGDVCLPEIVDAGTDGGADTGSDAGGWELIPYPGPYTGATPPDLDAVATSSASDVWVGGGAALLHFDGAWHDACSQPGASCTNITSLWDLAGELWALNDGDVLHWNRSAWESLGTAVPPTQPPAHVSSPSCDGQWASGAPIGVAGVADDNLFVLARYEWWCDYGGGYIDQGPTAWIIRWNGSNWVPGQLPARSSSGSAPAGLGVFSATDAWVVGTEADHFDGTAWSSVTATSSAKAIWKSSDDDIWIVGDNAAIQHWDGHTWSAVSAPGAMINNLTGIWGSSATDVWVVGGGGAILHYDGTQWSRVVSPTEKSLRAIWGSGAGEVWAVGDSGTILHLRR